MSGKKKSEVAYVLRCAEEARKVTEGIYDDSVNRDLQECEKCKSNLERIQNDCSTVELSGEAKKMFGAEAEAQAKNAADLLSKIRKAKVSDTVDSNSLGRINSEVNKLDESADKLRKVIADPSKNWYLDEEYKEAEQLRSEYQRLADKRKNLSRSAARQARDARETVNQVRSWKSQLEQVQDGIKNMNTVAENKKAADGLRKTVRKAFEDVDATGVKDFFAQEFKNTEEKIGQWVNQNDAEVIKQAGNIQKLLSGLVTKVEQKKQEKADSEAVAESVESVMKNGFYDPIDYLSNEGQSTSIPLEQYLQKFDNGLPSSIGDYLEKAQKAVAKGDFVQAKECYTEALKAVNEANDNAVRLQERMIAGGKLAVDIQDIMYKNGYNVDSDFIDGNPKNGYKVTCTVGGEIIDFSVYFDADGKPVMDPYHTEGAGSCHKTWQELSKVLRAKGIPLTDMKKDGQSVVYEAHSGVKKEKTFEQKKQRSRGV